MLVPCKQCEEEFEKSSTDVKRSKNHFCSQSCSAKYSNTRRKKKRYCECCGSELEKASQRKYCSIACTSLDHYNKYIKRWKEGKEKGYYGKNFTVSNTIRTYLFMRSAYKCEKCGWSMKNPTTEKIPLTINHIDGNVENCKEENLELICPNCHSLTPNYGALNKGNGKRKRN